MTTPRERVSNPAEAHGTPLLVNTLLVAGLAAACQILAERQPMTFAMLCREDGGVESLSFAAWVVASLLWLRSALVRPTGRLALLTLALAAFLVAGEEISWGQRIFGWESPEFFRTENLQAETNFHNLGVISSYYRLLPGAIVAWCVGGWWLVRLWPRGRDWTERFAIPLVPVHLWPFFFVAALAIADAGRWDRELAELLLALAACALAADMWRRSEASRTAIGVGPVPTTIVALLVAVPLLSWGTHAIGPPPDPIDPFRLARKLIMTGQHDRADTLLRQMESPDGEDRAQVLFLRALATQAVGNTEEATAIARSHVETALGASALGTEHLSRLPTAESARQTALVLCMLGRGQEAELALRHAQALDRGLLRIAQAPEVEAVTRASLAATLDGLGLARKARRETNQALARSPSESTRQQIRVILRQSRRLFDLAGCRSPSSSAAAEAPG